MEGPFSTLYIFLIASIPTTILVIVFFQIRALIKESRKLQEDLREERDLAKAIITSMGEGLLVMDINYKIQMMNPVAEQLLETTSNEAVGQKWDEFLRAYVGQREITFAERSAVKALQSGKIHTTTIAEDHYYETRSGRRFPVVAITAPLMREGVMKGIVKVFRDATKEKEIDKMKSEFISLASHQLRTPLSAIKWFVELMNDPRSGPLNPEQADFVKNIGTSTDRMVELVNALLNISRIESGRIVIDPNPTDLVDLVKNVVHELKRKIEEKRHLFVISTHGQLPRINIDPRLIRHVYLNLIDNSIKYTPQGGEITIFISKKANEVVSQISDNGYGMAKDEQSRVFQKFFRGKTVSKYVTEGTGLGLYLVKAIVASSGGRIWFASEEGKGTTFWFSLPIEGSKPKEGEVTLDT